MSDQVIHRRGFLVICAALGLLPMAVRRWFGAPVLEKFEWIAKAPSVNANDFPESRPGALGWRATVRHRGRIRQYADWVVMEKDLTAFERERMQNILRAQARSFLRSLPTTFRERDLA